MRLAATSDPTTFVDAEDLLVIDEIQRVPDLLLSIKESVDANPTPGRFLLTGSAHVLSLRTVPDALPGRLETIELWPLSQDEIDEADPTATFIDRVFSQGTEFHHTTALSRNDYIARLVRGGFPEAVARSGRRRESFFDNYTADMVNREVTAISSIERGPQMRALIRLLAARSGSLLVPGALATSLRISQATVDSYLALLEQVFLILRVPAWSRNLSARATRTSKVAFVDSGIAANLLSQDEAGLRRIDSPLGGLLEGFVVSELARQRTWSDTRLDLSHYRTKDGVEVDLIMEDRRGRVVAIEVKAAATVRAEDFRGIDHLSARLGSDLVAGIVLYTGAQTLGFGPGKLAVPIAALWEA